MAGNKSKNRNTDLTNANDVRHESADDFALGIYKLVEDEDEGLKYDILANPKYRYPPPYYQIAKILNENGYTTRRGAKWDVTSIRRLYKRVKDRNLEEQLD